MEFVCRMIGVETHQKRSCSDKILKFYLSCTIEIACSTKKQGWVSLILECNQPNFEETIQECIGFDLMKIVCMSEAQMTMPISHFWNLFDLHFHQNELHSQGQDK